MFATLIRTLTNVASGLALVVGLSTPASAATAVAISDNLSSASYVGKGATIERADEYALALCDIETRKRGVVPVCRVYGHTDTVGWYAVACGQLGCGAAIGKKSLRLAQEGAFQECLRQQKFCNTDLVAFGNDLPVPAQNAAKKDPSAGLPAYYRAGPAQ